MTGKLTPERFTFDILRDIIARICKFIFYIGRNYS